MMRVGYTRASKSTIRHIVSTDHHWYSGQTGTARCGAKVNVIQDVVVGTAAGFAQPAGTCKRCAATLGQTVRVA